MGAVMIHEALSKDIISAAMTGLNELKPGLDEKLYETPWSLSWLHAVTRLTISVPSPSTTGGISSANSFQT